MHTTYNANVGIEKRFLFSHVTSNHLFHFCASATYKNQERTTGQRRYNARANKDEKSHENGGRRGVSRPVHLFDLIVSARVLTICTYTFLRSFFKHHSHILTRNDCGELGCVSV